MSGAKGYHSYRGRGSRGKALLSVVLILVILAALAVMRLQEYIVYDESGRARLELPWDTAGEAEESQAQQELDLTLEITRAEGETVRGLQLPDAPLEAWDGTRLTGYGDGTCNAVALTMKDDGGNVYFAAQGAVSGTLRTQSGTAAALAGLLEDESIHTIARMSCFLDPKAANADVEGRGLKNTGGYIFYDGNNRQWLDPGKPAAREYLCGLARELAELGFDEILLTDVTYPTEGKLNKIDYGETMKAENLAAFLDEMAAALEPYSVTLSVELPGSVVTEGSDNTAGLMLTDVALRVDRIYAEAAPEEISAMAQAVAAASQDAEFVPEVAEPLSGEDDAFLCVPS